MPPLAENPSVFFTGTAGWSYEDWRGRFFPDRLPDGTPPLAWYARFFNFVEVNATFYRILPPSAGANWLRCVARRADFLFALKIHREFTHERPSALPERPAIAFASLCRVLHEAERLGAVLMQFPWSFRCNEENCAWLERLLDRFTDFPVAVEVRHASWESEAYFELLRARGVACCNVDQPALRDCLGPAARATAPFSYLRLHGRNAPNWFREDAASHERYDYLYDASEIDELAQLAEALALQTGRVMTTTNNHYRGQAAANALQLRARLEGRVDALPEPLLREFPPLRALGPLAKDPPSPFAEQQDIFDSF